jgi:hypothetical protein
MRAAVFHGAFDIQVEQILDAVRLQTLPVTRILVSIAHFGANARSCRLQTSKTIARTARQYERERVCIPSTELVMSAAFCVL